MSRFDAIVIGIGGMGSAALYHLARRGRRVLGLEQFSLGHELGSSHGVTRIIRLAYAEHPDYVPLLRRAYQLWREMEIVAAEPLLIRTGGFDIGPAGGTMIEGSLQSCSEHDLPYELLDAAQIARRHPGYRLPSDMVGVYQAEGGFVLPERSIATHVAAALALGAEVHACEPVIAWEPRGSGVEVRTARDTYFADRLVITAGPWAAQFLPQLQPLAVPERQVLIWTQPSRPDLFTPAAFPIFNMDAPEGRFYGFPIYSVPGFKLGKYHHRHELTHPDHVIRTFDAEDEAVLREGIARYFPDANGPTLALKTCMFTNSPDEHFVIDRHPACPQVAFAAGFSGHGFKFAPVIGELLTALALDEAAPQPLFRLDRFVA